MTWLLLLQLFFLGLGAAALPVFGLARTRAQLVTRLPIAYMIGVALTGILAAHLALLDVEIGPFELLFLTVVLALVVRHRGFRNPESRASPAPGIADALLLVGAFVSLAHLTFMLERRPLYEWDGWAIWATKARALYEFGGAYEPVVTTYPPVQHPLFFPALEAVDFQVLGQFDGILVHVQLGLLAFGFAAALWTLLRERAPAILASLTVLALVTATAFVQQLSTNYADVPLAIFVALGVVSLARWLMEGDRGMLAATALFLGAATLIKPEGLLFAAAAFVAALLAGTRPLLRGTLLAAAATALLYLPWRVYAAAHGLENPEYSFGNALDPGYLADRAERVGPAVSSLARHAFSLEWGLLAPLGLAAIVAAFLSGRTRLGVFATAWAALSFLGLVLVFWISVVPIDLTLQWTAYRIVASLVIGAAALAPLLASDAWATIEWDRVLRLRDSGFQGLRERFPHRLKLDSVEHV